MKTTKRIVALLLTFAMLATSLCLSVFVVHAASPVEKTATASEIEALLEGEYALTNNSNSVVTSQTVTYIGDNCYRAQGICANGGGANAYCTFLESKGFTFYVDKGENKYLNKHLGATNARNQMYSDGTYLVTVFWDNGNDLLTVTMEPLPADAALKAEYLSVFTPQTTEKVCEPVAIQMGLDVDDAYDGNETKKVDLRSGMSYVFRLSDGSFVIYDGGASNATTHQDTKHGLGTTALRKNMYRLLAVLNTYAVDKNDIRIAAWLITHPHSDHYDLFEQVVKEMYNPSNSHYGDYANITLERVIANYPDYDQLDNCTTSKNANGACDAVGASKFETHRNVLITCEQNGALLYKAHAGQTYYLADAELAILYTEDIALSPSGNAKCSCESGDQSEINRLSIISQLTLPVNGYDVKFMITGDSEGESIQHVNGLYGTSMKSDFVQSPHHGNIDAGNSNKGTLDVFFNDNVKAGYLLVPTSDDWWNGEVINAGDVGRITYAPLYTKHKEGAATNFTCQYADTIGLENTFVAGSASREFEMTVTEGTLSVTPAVLVFGESDIDNYVTADSHFKMLDAITVEDDEPDTLPTDNAGNYLIGSAEDFLLIANDLTANYVLTDDITVPAQDDGDGKMVPVHFETFQGTLDGGYHTVTIEGVYTGSASYGMLFNSLNGATIKNIQIGTAVTPVDYDRTAHTGGWNAGVIGSNATGKVTISNVTIWVDADFTQQEKGAGNFGVFLGKIDNAASDVAFINCVANGDIYSENQNKSHTFAGFVGSASKAISVTFESCTNNATITSTTTTGLMTAGFVGKDNANCVALTFENCLNNGTISGVGISAGILAKCVGSAVSMTNVVNYGDVNGLAGSVGSMVGTRSGTLTTVGCVNVGKLNGEVGSEDGIVGAIAQTNKGAGIRIANKANESGLRFKFEMDETAMSALAELIACYGEDNVEVGAIILSTDLLENGVAFTAENYSNASTMTSKISEIEDGCYYMSIVEIYEASYNIAYSCRSFWRFRTSAEGEWVTVYANNTLSRTVAGVADAFLADQTVDFSRYTAEQMAVVSAYAAANG